jgi:hypothetical protein
MPNFDPTLAIAVLTANPDTFGATVPERQSYIEEVRAHLSRSADDKKEAAKIAVDAAKQLVTIAIAVLAAVAALVQAAHNNGVPWLSAPMICFALTALAALISMISGLVAISRTYKRADGRRDAQGVPWSTADTATPLNIQSSLGVASFVLVLAGVIFWAASSTQTVSPNVMVAQPPGPLSARSFSLTGNWNDLTLSTAAKYDIKLPPSSAPVTIDCR